MKKVCCLIVCAFLVSTLTLGCLTIPEGWENASSADVVDFSALVLQALSKEIDKINPMQRCVLESGYAGCVKFWETRDSDKDINKRLLLAVNAADSFAKENYADLYAEHGNLSKIVVVAVKDIVGDNPDIIAIIDRADDSEILLSVINTFINAPVDKLMKLGDI